MSIKLEYGKKYVCRNGAVVGPLEKQAGNEKYSFGCHVEDMSGISTGRELWKGNGGWNITDKEHEFDIVAEYHEYVWKWMVPDKPGVWMSGGSKRNAPDLKRVAVVHIMSEWLEGWYCFLMDLPQIQMPPKQLVTKRLWIKNLDVNEAVFKPGCEVPEFKKSFLCSIARFEEPSIEFLDEDGWIRTDKIVEMTE